VVRGIWKGSLPEIRSVGWLKNFDEVVEIDMSSRVAGVVVGKI
jgi:hypothetical protein